MSEEAGEVGFLGPLSWAAFVQGRKSGPVILQPRAVGAGVALGEPQGVDCKKTSGCAAASDFHSGIFLEGQVTLCEVVVQVPNSNTGNGF